MSPLKLCAEFCVCVFSGPNRVYWSLPGLAVHETAISIVLGKEYVRSGADTTLHRQEQPGMETSQLAQAAPCTFPALTGATATLLGREVRTSCSAMPHHQHHSRSHSLWSHEAGGLWRRWNGQSLFSLLYTLPTTELPRAEG